MRRVSDLCDYFFICSATSTRHSKAIADGIREALHKKGLKPWHVEGGSEALWILLDYNEVVVHIFSKEVRSFYNLERLWGDAPRVKLAETEKPKRKPGQRLKRIKCKKTPSRKAFPA